MGMTVRHFLRCHTSAEIAELMAFDRLEPFGTGRTNLSIGELAALTANLSRDPKKWPEPFRGDQFVALYRPYERPVQPKKPAKRNVGLRLRDHLKRKKA